MRFVPSPAQVMVILTALVVGGDRASAESTPPAATEQQTLQVSSGRALDSGKPRLCKTSAASGEHSL